VVVLIVPGPNRQTQTVTRSVTYAWPLLSGWGGFNDSELPDNVFCLDEVPHDWLSPRVLANQVTSAITNTEMRNRAAAVGRYIRNENGVEKTVNLRAQRLAEFPVKNAHSR